MVFTHILKPQEFFTLGDLCFRVISSSFVFSNGFSIHFQIVFLDFNLSIPACSDCSLFGGKQSGNMFKMVLQDFTELLGKIHSFVALSVRSNMLKRIHSEKGLRSSTGGDTESV